MKKGIGILLACAMILSGCSGKQTDENENKPEKQKDDAIHLYTLKDNENLHQSVKLFEDKYPEYKVIIDVGVSDEDGMTVSDAIRSLNTELMAGNGPDILLLDGLPIEDYIEKGVLEDVSDSVESVKAGGEVFFENVLSSYAEEDKIYAVPAFFSVPIIIGKEGAVTQESVQKISGTLKARTEEEIAGLARNATASIPLLLQTSWNDIIVKDNAVDKEALTTFLEETKLLFEAANIDLNTEYAKTFPPFTRMQENYPNYFGDGGLDIAYKKDVLAVGTLDMGQILAQLKSVSEQIPVFYQYLNVENGKQFLPKWIFGVASSSEKKEAAKAFLSYFMSAENMDRYDWEFSVNQTSFRNVLPISETKEMMTIMYEDQAATNGIEIKKLNAQEAEEFVNFLSEADTKIAVNRTVFETILTEAKKYAYGEESLEDVASAIIEKVEIYQAE